MAALRLRGGTILEENLARTAGSIGESIAAGAIFTIPAFVISRAWPSFDFEHAYWKSTALMMMGGILGVLFVSLVRRVMVEDPELPFPESRRPRRSIRPVSAGAKRRNTCSTTWRSAASVFCWAPSTLRAGSGFLLPHGRSGPFFRAHGGGPAANTLPVGGVSKFAAPSVSPAYIGVRIRHRTAAGLVECRRKRPRLGPAGAAVDLFPGTRHPEVCARARRRGGATKPPGTDWPTACGVSSCAHRRGRNDGWGRLHLVPHAQEPRCGAGKGVRRTARRAVLRWPRSDASIGT